MEQRFLTQEELQKQEAEMQSQQILTEVKQETTSRVGKPLDTEVVDDLMRQLNEEEGTRTDPHWMLPHEREALLEQLTRQAHAQKRRRQRSQSAFWIGMTLIIGLSPASLFEHFYRLSYITLAFTLFYAVFVLCVNLAERRWVRVTEGIALFDDLRATGPLLEALSLRDPSVIASAEKALLRLLPRLQASDAASITETQRESLYRRLKIQKGQPPVEFLLAALKALEQTGDEKAIPCVEALADSTATNPGAVRIREAAKRCLAFLKVRVQQKQSSDRLLRASSDLDAPSNALLRPAPDNPSTDPRLLLRSSGRTGGEGVDKTTLDNECWERPLSIVGGKHWRD